MGPLGWWLIGAGVWVFVAVTFPLLWVLIDGPTETQHESRVLVGLSWIWPIMIPVILAALVLTVIIGAITGVVTGVGWVVDKYTSILMKKTQESGELLEGKVVE